MVCVYCRSKTKTVNSRFQRKTGRTWRRHNCTVCNATFTTYETVDWASTFSVVRSGTHEAFSISRLTHDLRTALGTHSVADETAELLAHNVTMQLIGLQRNAVITTEQIKEVCSTMLHNFHYPAYLRYCADNSIKPLADSQVIS